MQLVRLGLTAAAFTALLHNTAAAQRGVLEGSVSADSLGKRSLAGAELSIPALQLTVRANFAGEYRLANVTPGRYLVVARMAGYATVGDSVTIAASGKTYHDFVLATKAVVLDSVISTAIAKPPEFLSAALRGFEERRTAGSGGYFIAEADLRKNDNSRLTEVILSRIPGLMSLSDPNHGDVVYFASSRDHRKNAQGELLPVKPRPPDPSLTTLRACFVSVYIDGVRIYDMDMTDREGVNPPDFNKLAVNQFTGVEFYAGAATTPSQFASNNSACGVLVLWTRER